MYSVIPRQIEKFHLILLLLLLHVPEATYFDKLRNMERVELPIFKEACDRVRLLEDDAELHNALTVAATFRLPQQLLKVFDMMLPIQPSRECPFWDEYKHSMNENLLIDNDESAAKNLTLDLFSAILRENRISYGALDLPEP